LVPLPANLLERARCIIIISEREKERVYFVCLFILFYTYI